MSAFSNTLIDRIYDLRKALHEISYAEPARKPAELARVALAVDDKTRDRAALDLSVHAESVATRAIIELKAGD